MTVQELIDDLSELVRHNGAVAGFDVITVSRRKKRSRRVTDVTLWGQGSGYAYTGSTVPVVVLEQGRKQYGS